MAKFNFQPRVGDSDRISAGLGTVTPKFTDAELNKIVKLGANSNYVAVAAGDEIEGVIIAVAPHTVNDGFAFGTVQTGGRLIAQNGAADTLAAGDYVVAAAQSAVGTAQEYPLVQKAEEDSDQIFRWRVIDLLAGSGAQGDQVVVERVAG